MNELAKSLCKYLIRQDPGTEFRIKTGTEMYRKGFGEIRLENPDGSPMDKAEIHLKQKTHEFLFGCNAFMLDQFPAKEQNQRYREIFSDLFNEAVIPFYWKDLEPEDGKLRFTHGSTPIYRRPPSDDVLKFCHEKGITPKGHPLCWHNWVPDWLPLTAPEVMRRLDRRLEEIAARYGRDIFLWDCVNEAQSRRPYTRWASPAFPDNYVSEVFRLADRHFPLAKLLYNDDRHWWNLHGESTPVFLLVRDLMRQGIRIGGLGLQFHLFEDLLHGEHEKFLNPKVLYACLDLYETLGIPVNFSEVSIISRRDLGNGDEFQRLVTERLYRIWFSHPAVEGITWWNLVDGTASGSTLGGEDGENSLRAGLVNYDFTSKPAFEILKQLIHKEWHTETVLQYEAGAINAFHGFYGRYDAEIRTDFGTFFKEIVLSRNGMNQTSIRV